MTSSATVETTEPKPVFVTTSVVGRSKREDEKKLKARVTVYDEHGNWEVYQHHDDLRRIENPVFTRYYRDLQRITTDWDAFSAMLRTPLSTTIWINDTDPLAGDVSKYLLSLVESGLVSTIPWYPHSNMAFRIKSDKTAFRKAAEMQPLRQYLIRQTALGTVSRQEEVSMIPPLLLEIQPNDICLDMCASPGSKTAQMLVALGRHKVVPFNSDKSPFPFDYLSAGMIMANELDTKRANMLVHQVKRMRLLFPFALFANHDARFFPDVYQRPPPDAGDDAPDVLLKFDKVLCDVVCSGDGTIRKAPFIFKVWSPKEAINLQKTQIQIALRGCHLLKVGGRLVYSTCSLNPIENEAVVSQVVLRTQGAMRIVDAQGILPRLTCDKGLTTWVVTDKKGDPASGPSDELHPALFPLAADECPYELDLTRCMRFLPHHCDGGGFFIAVLEKVSPFDLPRPRALAASDVEGQQDSEDHPPAKRTRDAVTQITTSSDAKAILQCLEGDEPRAFSDCSGKLLKEQQKAKRKKKRKAEDQKSTEVSTLAVDTARPARIPPHFVHPTADMIRSLTDFYHISDFPIANLVVRTANNERTLSVTYNTTCSLVADTPRNILLRRNTQPDHLVIVSAGLRLLAFERLDNGWRIAYEAALLFVKLMAASPRVVRVSVAQVVQLINSGKLKDVPLEELENPVVREQLKALGVGTVLLLVECPFDRSGFVPAVGLRARTRLQLLVDHEDLVGFQLRLGLDVAGGEKDSVDS
jgi:tRNA (cytosine34-C5)-methyltransferase